MDPRSADKTSLKSFNFKMTRIKMNKNHVNSSMKNGKRRKN